MNNAAIQFLLASSMSAAKWACSSHGCYDDLLALFVASTNPDVIAPACTWAKRYDAFRAEVRS